MASAHDIFMAGENLRRHLARHRWLTAVGVGRDRDQDCLYVYASQLTPTVKAVIPDRWEGFRVVPRRMDIPRPAHH